MASVARERAGYPGSPKNVGFTPSLINHDQSFAEYLADGILAYFGHPLAHEDDPERAVRASLGIVNQMEALNASLPRAAESTINSSS